MNLNQSPGTNQIRISTRIQIPEANRIMFLPHVRTDIPINHLPPPNVIVVQSTVRNQLPINQHLHGNDGVHVPPDVWYYSPISNYPIPSYQIQDRPHVRNYSAINYPIPPNHGNLVIPQRNLSPNNQFLSPNYEIHDLNHARHQFPMNSPFNGENHLPLSCCHPPSHIEIQCHPQLSTHLTFEHCPPSNNAILINPCLRTHLLHNAPPSNQALFGVGNQFPLNHPCPPNNVIRFPPHVRMPLTINHPPHLNNAIQMTHHVRISLTTGHPHPNNGINHLRIDHPHPSNNAIFVQSHAMNHLPVPLPSLHNELIQDVPQLTTHFPINHLHTHNLIEVLPRVRNHSLVNYGSSPNNEIQNLSWVRNHSQIN